MNFFDFLIIRYISSKVRKGIYKKYKKEDNFDSNLWGYCAIASGVLHTELKKYGILTKIIMTERNEGVQNDGAHCFLLYKENVIIDITASQFSEKNICILNEGKIFDSGDERWYWFNGKIIFDSPEELREIQQNNGWPDEQICYS